MSKLNFNHDGCGIFLKLFWFLMFIGLFVHSVAFGSNCFMLEMLRCRPRRRRNVGGEQGPQQGEPVRKTRKVKKKKKKDCHQFATQEEKKLYSKRHFVSGGSTHGGCHDNAAGGRLVLGRCSCCLISEIVLKDRVSFCCRQKNSRREKL